MRRGRLDIRTRAALGLLITGGLAFGALPLVDPPDDAAYLGSGRCQSCHRADHQAWAESHHTRMMRPVTRPGVVTAQFGTGGLDPGFDLDEAVWAIGGKWEQQFMAVRNGREELLPGAWHVLTQQWDLQSWDGWQEPDPVRRCNGCHTVGLNPDTGEYVETNIGCESCHGPGSWHVATWGLGQIPSGLESEVCGQCHARGREPETGLYYPSRYRPGGPLAFNFREPSPGQNSTSWWGNGSERKRHQEFQAWSRGGHTNALESLGKSYDGRYGPIEDDCYRCHAAEAALGLRGPPQNGVSCAVCHNVHGALDQPRIECGACHGDGIYHRPEANAAHIPCPPEAVTCVDCHMPVTGRIGGAFALHSHRPGIVHPADTARFGVPNSCNTSGCHQEFTVAELQGIFASVYSEP